MYNNPSTIGILLIEATLFAAPGCGNWLFEGQKSSNSSSSITGPDIQSSTKLCDPLTHAPETNSHWSGRRETESRLDRHALTLIANLKLNMAVRLYQANLGCGAARMTMYVGKAFLYDSENSDLKV